MDSIITEFGKTLGIDNLSFDSEPSFQLKIESYGTVIFESTGQGLVIALMREYDFMPDALCAKALNLCHYREGHPFAINVGLRGDNKLAFSFMLTEEEVSVPTIDQSIKWLNNVHNRLSNR